jgi:hypothetical protein
MATSDHDRLWNHLFGRVQLTPAEARDLRRRLDEAALVREAEQAAHGAHHLTVAHGDPESAEDADRVHQLFAWTHLHRARAVFSAVATNDTVRWTITGPDAEAVLVDLEAVAEQLNPGWWRIRRAAR